MHPTNSAEHRFPPHPCAPQANQVRNVDYRSRSRGYLSRLARWTVWGTGLAALLWFLVRVIPKPSRAAYPCQRAAAPMASAFVVWLLGLLGAKWACLHRRDWARRFGMAGAMLGTALALLCGLVAVLSLPTRVASGGTTPAPHGSVGIGKGIYPGRVVWVHAPEATDWAGFYSTEHWWQTNHTDLAMVEQMMTEALRRVAGQATEAAAWDALFHHFNQTHSRNARGYQVGEKIAIKINLTTCNGGNNSVDLRTYEKKANVMNTIDNSPQMLLALLRQLVYVAGVPQDRISLGDPTALFPAFLYNFLHPEFPNVHYFDAQGNSGRTLTTFSTTPFYWSTTNANGKLPDYVPVPFAEADYLINFAILKGHSSGVTLCGKNLYGALLRCPSGYLYSAKNTLDYYNLHLSLPNAGWSPGLGHYRAIVDLLGAPQLGNKTLLCLIDGLFAGYYWDSRPYPWKTAPFSNGSQPHWPSSLLVSQDPVAIDSVAYDLLLNEWPQVVTTGGGDPDSLEGGAEDYLHEAALADHPPSGAFYDPGRTGASLASLGVHEHWNNPIDRQYSRNLGQTNGIELVYARLAKTPPSLALHRGDSGLVLSWPTSQYGYTLQSAASLAPPVVWTPVTTLPATLQAQNVVSNDIAAPAQFYRLNKE